MLVRLSSVWCMRAYVKKNELLIDTEPNQVGSCPRCPDGVHLAGVAPDVAVLLLDIYNNTLAFCHPASAFCKAHTGQEVLAQLWLSSSTGASEIVTGTATTQDSVTQAVSAAGRAVFDGIRISMAGMGYSLRFLTPRKSLDGKTIGLITVQTSEFMVTAGQPVAIAAVHTRRTLLATDAEYFLVQPHIEFLDAFENRVVNNCYTDCGGTLTGLCSLTETPCSAHAEVRVDIKWEELLQTPSFDGTRAVLASNGLAMFTDLKIDLFGESTRGSDAVCACSQSSCPSCSTCYDAEHPLEDVTLIFTTSIDGVVLTTETVVNIAHRVQKLKILNQPEDNDVQVVAQDAFVQPIIVQAQSCGSQPATSVVATCTISIRDSPEAAQLFGTMTEPVESGVFLFTNLLVDLAGSYTLQFQYGGNSLVQTISSATFIVAKQVYRIDISVSPENTTTVAGVRFLTQPRLRLLDEDGAIALGSSKSVTASIGTDPGASIPHLPGPSKLYGTLVVSAERGAANFMDLSLQKASVGQGANAKGYTLQFSHASMKSVSMEFYVVPDKWVGLHVPFYSQPLSSVAGHALARQPHVFLVDQFTNRVLPSQVPYGTRVNASLVERIEYYPGNPARLLRHRCDETCSPGPIPVICSTCSDLSLSAAAGWVQYTDLRIDIAHGAYHLRFNTTDGKGSRLSVLTQAFSILSGDGAGLLSNQFERKQFADQDLAIQPQLLLTDLYGNRVTDVSSLTDSILHARLVTVGGQLPVAPPMQPVPGQPAGSVCSVYPNPLRGNVQANISTGIAEFTDLTIRQAMPQYRLEFEVETKNGPLTRTSRFFDVAPGVPVRLCNMSLPNRCSQLSECLDFTEIVCVDEYGNVQEQCKVCNVRMPVDGMCIDGSNAELAKNWNDACPLGMVCAQLLSPTYADGASEKPSISSVKTCGTSGSPCASVQPKSGPYGALFDSLKFPFPSADYVVRFYTYLAHPTNSTSKILLEYQTPRFSVIPPRPQVQSVLFSNTFVELHFQFDRLTNKLPKMFGETEGCDDYLAPEFIRTLGIPVTCRWASSSRLIAYLGVNASVGPFTQVLLSPHNTIKHLGTYNGYEMTSLPATTDVGVFVGGIALQPVYPRIPAQTAVPKPVTMGAENIGACELLRADARASTGNAGRRYSEIKWGLNFDQTYALDGILSAKGKPLFINRFIDFSTLRPGEVSTVTLRLRPNAGVIQGSIITIHGLPGHTRKALGCVPKEEAAEAPPRIVPCISKFNTRKHMLNQAQDSSYTNSKCIDVPLRGPGAKYFELNGTEPGTGVPVAQWFEGGVNGVELHIRVLGMRADAGNTPCPREGLDCTQCNCASYLPAGEVTEIQFDMVNPHVATKPRRLMIESNCDTFYYACNPTFANEIGGPRGPMNWLKQENEMQLNCGRNWNEGAACQDTVIFGMNDFDINLVSGNISETTAVRGARNTLTVTVVPSTPLPAGTRILLRGLEGSSTKSGAVCLHNSIDLQTRQALDIFDCSECSFGMPFARWTAGTGSLEVTIKNGSFVTEAGLAFSFELYNADYINRQSKSTCAERDVLKCPSVAHPEILLLSPARYSGTYVSLPGDVLGSGFVPKMLTANVVEGNSLQGHFNLLVFEFSANVDFFGGSVVTIWTDSAAGLGTSINNIVEHFYAGSENTGCWGLKWHTQVGHNATAADISQGRYVIGAISLRLSSQCNVPATELSRIAIRVLNSHIEAAPPSIFINMTYASCKGCVDNCACSKIDTPDLVVPNFPVQGNILQSNTVAKFVHVVARESTTIRSQQNTLEVEFQSSFDMISFAGEETKLMISGLAGLATPSGAMSIDVRVESELATSTNGEFDADAGSLTLDLPVLVPALSRISLSFLVQNGPTAQEPQKIVIKADASAALCGSSIRAICQRLNLGLAKSSLNPVQVPELAADVSILGFAGRPRPTLATIRELTRVNGAFNILTVHVRTNFLIQSPASISVSNLLGTRWPLKVVNEQINVVRHFTDLLPNCSCSVCEPDLSCACDDTVLIQYDRTTAFLWQPEGSNLFGTPNNRLANSEVQGSWDPTKGDLHLNFVQGREIRAGEDIVFSFTVKNPNVVTYRPRRANVTITTPDFRVETMLDGLVLGSAAAPGFSLFTVSETSKVAGEFNEIFIAIESNFPMVSLQRDPAQLLVQGMKGFNTPGGFMPIFGSQAFSVAKTGYGNWTTTTTSEPAELQITSGVMMGGCQTVGGVDSCALKVPGVFDYTALSIQRFSFIIQNTMLMNAGDNALTIQYIGEFQTPRVQSLSDPIGRALEVASIEHVQLTESSAIQRVGNEITLRIRFNVLLAPTSSITLTGFKGSLTTSGSLALSGQHGQLFVGQFNGPNGIVLLTLKEGSNVIPAKTDLEIKFVLLNPISQQDPAFFTVEATLISPQTRLPDRSACAAGSIWYFGPTRRVPSTLIRGTTLFEAGEPLSFTTKNIRESTMVNWAVNNISVALVSPVRLPVDTVITLSGLATPIPSRSSFPIKGPARDAFYFVDPTCPLQGDIQIACISTVEWDSGRRELQLKLTREVPAGQSIEISFLFRNRGCRHDCAGFSIIISATGPLAASHLVFEPERMDGAVMGAGVEYLSWIKKTVTQDHMVRSAPNKLKFSFRPNAPLYEGTKIVIEGILGSETTTCRACRPPSIIEGLGCDEDCKECAPQEIEGGNGQTFRPCIPVYQPDPQSLTKHVKFVKNSPWFSKVGSLTLEVAAGYLIPQDEDTEVFIVVQNGIAERVSRAECIPSNTPADLDSPSQCMTIRAQTPALCNPAGEFGDQCAKPDGASVPDPAPMDVKTKAIDAYGNPLVDTNPVIVRLEDFHVIQKTIEVIPALLLDNVPVDVPSLRGVPTLKKGVLPAAHYSLYVNLTNWLNNTAIADFDFHKDHPPQGQGKGVLANEYPKPLLMIEGPRHLRIKRDDVLILNARGQPMDCYPHVKDSLAYVWRMECEDGEYGYCSLPPGDNIVDLVQSPKVPDLVVLANSTIPGAKYTFVCDVSQWFVRSQAKVDVEVDIRPPVVKIEGVNRGGYVRADRPLTLTAKNSYDPEQFMTGLSTADFRWSWGCKELTKYCTLPPQLCPPNQFVDCDYYWMRRDLSQGHTITTNETTFKPGWIYRITVNATRDGHKLINGNKEIDDQIFAAPPVKSAEEEEEEEEEEAAEITLDDLIVDPRWLKRATQTVEFNTLPETGMPVVVTVVLCDPGQLGTRSLCQSPVIGKVDPGSKLVLQASGESQGGGVIIGYYWQVESETEELSEDMLLTSQTGPLLILRPNVLANAAEVKFTVRLQDSSGNVGSASMTVLVNQPPSSGRLIVNPTTGYALDTDFKLEADQWETVEENYPLDFNYFYVVPDATNTQIRLGRGMSTETMLPAGDAAAGYILDVGVRVSDVHQTSVNSMARVTVRFASPTTDIRGLIEGGLQKVDDLLERKNHIEALGLVGSISQTLNQAADVCVGDVKAECISGDECCDRKELKLRLFSKLQQGDSNMDFDASKVARVVNIMKTVSARPQELSFELVRQMSRFIKEKFDELKLPGISSAVNDAESLADGFSTVLENLVSRATAIIPTKVQVPYTLLEQHHEDGARLKPLLPQTLSLRERRDGITVENARGVVTQLIELISETSRLSVQHAEVGQKPVVIRRQNFIVNTSLLNVATLTSEYLAETEIGISAALPSNLFKAANIRPPALTSGVVEIMHTVFDEPHNPLPGAKGPVLILESRERGKVQSIDFNDPLLKPIRIQVILLHVAVCCMPMLMCAAPGR